MDSSAQHKFQFSDEIFINYDIHGHGHTAIIFLHGFGASRKTWDDIAAFFSSDLYSLYLIDLKGFGLSSKPHDGHYSFEDQANIILAFISFLSLHGIILIGHSFGGGVALLISIILEASAKKNVIKDLVLIDCAAFTEDIPFPISFLQNPILNFISQDLVPADLKARFSLTKAFYDKDKVTQKIIDRYAVYLNGPDYEYALTQTAKEIVPDNYDNIVKAYSHISAPTLIIWGKNDPILSLENGKKLNRLISESTLKIIKNCGHIPQEELPKETFEIIADFLRVRGSKK